jgi:hypothetical protein
MSGLPAGRRQASLVEAFPAGDIAVRKYGYTQHDVNTIRIDAEATSIGAGLADPPINPMARAGVCGVWTKAVPDAGG